MKIAIGIDMIGDREFKGESLVNFIDNYSIIDIETTGLDTYFDDIIEMSALKVRNNNVIDKFSKLIKINGDLPEFITEKTHITNEMLYNGEQLAIALTEFLDFIGYDILIGHNINFDINFLYDNSINIFKKPIKNDFIDTLRLSRCVLKQLPHHRLIDLMKFFSLKERGLHRALNDCFATKDIYDSLKEYVNKNNLSLDLINKLRERLKVKDIVSDDNTEFDESHPAYGKTFVFTGSLSMLRKDAMKLVVNKGGLNAHSITGKTNYLVLGNLDYEKCKGEKSAKLIKAEKLIISGYDLQILSENSFLDLINEG